MADYRTSIDYALRYGNESDPLYAMLRRRMRDMVYAQQQGQQRSALGNLDARGLGQSGAVAGTLGAIAGQGQQAMATGYAGIAQQQAAERFRLLQDAIQAERAKPSFWDYLIQGMTAGGSGVAQMLRESKKKPGQTEGYGELGMGLYQNPGTFGM